MKVKTNLPHRLPEILRERKISGRQLGREAGIASAYMNKILRGEMPLHLKQAMMVCGALNINSYELYGLRFDKKLIHDLDDVLLGSITVWLAEACDMYKMKLVKPEFSRWVSFLYKEALTKSLNGNELHNLVTTTVKILQQAQQKKN